MKTKLKFYNTQNQIASSKEILFKLLRYRGGEWSIFRI